MNRRHSLLAGLLMLGATNAQSLPGPNDPPAKGILPPAASLRPSAKLPARPKQAPSIRAFDRLPLSFERNQGQTDSQVSFLTHSGDSALFLTPSEAVFSMAAQPPQKVKPSLLKGRKNRQPAAKIASVTLRMQMVGANPKATVLQQQPLDGKVNYFIGRDPKKWHAGIPTFGRVGFQGVYPGVDLVYYGNQRNLEYDFMVAPHADPKQIKLHFAGAKQVQVNAAGELVVRTQGRELKWQKPSVYQQDAQGKHTVPAQFQRMTLPNGQTGVGFALGHYDTARPLVIDPVLTYSTYLGGSAVIGRGDYTTAIAVDNTGAAYVTGNAYSANFPINADPAYLDVNKAAKAINEMNTSNAVAFITKINATGTRLVYSTYIGGSTRDSGEGIGVDAQGNAYIAGESSSSNLPITYLAFQQSKFSASGTDTCFVAGLDPMGANLIYCTYFGGNGFDSAFGIAVDPQGDAYITGDSSVGPQPTIPFPIGTSVPAPAFQQNNNTSQNETAFVSMFDPFGNPIYSTYVGGEWLDTSNGIAIDAAGNAYITGATYSTKFPTTKGAFLTKAPQSSRSDSSAYVAVVTPDGTDLVYSTYLGGTTGAGDIGYAIAVDSAGSAYVTGAASASDFPTTKGVYQPTSFRTASYTAYVSKLTPDGSALAYSTYLGGSNSPQSADGDIGYGIAVDSIGEAYVTGETTDYDFPTTVDSFQRTSSLYGSNAFITKLNTTGTTLLYSTFLSGSGTDPSEAGEIARGIALDANGNAYVTGSTYSPDFPVTNRALQTNNKAAIGGANSFITKLATPHTVPDFYNSGYLSVMLQNSTTSAIISWYLQGTNYVNGSFFSQTPPSDYALIGAGDFGGAGAGVTTLVFQSKTTNKIIYWYTGGVNNATITGGDYVNVTPALGWNLVGVADFNGDGKSDLVLQNVVTNKIAIYFMNGPYYQGGVLLPYVPPTGWKVVGVGDFNGDGQTDIAFQVQSTGQIALWYMTGTTYAGGLVLPFTPAVGWSVAGVGDYNGDGYADLLFQNQTSGQVALWYLQSGVYLGGSLTTATPPPGWKVVGPR